MANFKFSGFDAAVLNEPLLRDAWAHIRARVELVAEVHAQDYDHDLYPDVDAVEMPAVLDYIERVLESTTID